MSFSGPKVKFNNWEIAVLVNVVHVREDSNNVTRIKLDLNCKLSRIKSLLLRS